MTDVLGHLDRIATEAGLEVMGSAGILGILWNREVASAEVFLALTASDVETYYRDYVVVAVDHLERVVATL
jgi:hypothetical protein